MASIERLNTIQLVRVALDSALDAAANDKLSQVQRDRAESAALKLRIIEGRLILDTVAELVADLKDDVKPLKALVNKMKDDVAVLKGVAKNIAAAAKAIGILVDIAAKAISAGIL